MKRIMIVVCVFALLSITSVWAQPIYDLHFDSTIEGCAVAPFGNPDNTRVWSGVYEHTISPGTGGCLMSTVVYGATDNSAIETCTHGTWKWTKNRLLLCYSLV